MYLPNDHALLRAYAIGLTAFERRDNRMLWRCVKLMNNRALRLGLSSPRTLKLWELPR